MAENGPCEEIAKVVSSNLLSIFKWEQYGPYDQDFPCRKQDKHLDKEKTQKHTHPVDVVFGYKDPYSNKNILFNTDLKSYGKGSISPTKIEEALTSLAKTIDCAENSPHWQAKYLIPAGDFEVRGLLFVYNHDNQYQKGFYDLFYPPKREKGKKGKLPKPVQLSKIPVPKDKKLHFVEPLQINYWMTIASDINEMIRHSTFPKTEFGFYYPELTFHKVVSSEKYLPATIEMLSSPFIIIKHDAVNDIVDREIKKVYESGYVVYYNRAANSDNEFLYLLDLLSKFQLLNAENKIRLKVPHTETSGSARSHFNRALEKYAHEWGYDEKMKKRLDIKLDLIPYKIEFYNSEDIGWKGVHA
ncbi:TPA: hypothetical protein ACGG77_002226 [Vibrio cholerae]